MTKLAGKKQNLVPMWKLLNKGVDLGEPTSFLDHVYLGCTQRQCEISKDIVENDRAFFFGSAGAAEKLPCSGNLSILQGTLPSSCIPNVVRLKTGEVLYEKEYMSPRLRPKISLRHDWTKELGSKVARQSREEVVRQL